MSKFPKTIFKYEGFNVRSLQNLKSQAVYFASPSQFNDPYDCAINAGIAEPTTKEVDALRRHFLKHPELPLQGRVQFESLSHDELKEKFIHVAEQAVAARKIEFLAGQGVSCFSERNEDLLMWSHYGGRYKGLCLEFWTKHKPFVDKLRKVKYVRKMPKISISSFFIDKESHQLVDLFCTKAYAWRYEHEWRMLHKEAGTLYTYPAEALKAVYFGPDIEDQAAEIVCLVLGGQNPDVELWQGSRSEQRFSVEFAQFEYTPYIVAKEKGLV